MIDPRNICNFSKLCSSIDPVKCYDKIFIFSEAIKKLFYIENYKSAHVTFYNRNDENLLASVIVYYDKQSTYLINYIDSFVCEIKIYRDRTNIELVTNHFSRSNQCQKFDLRTEVKVNDWYSKNCIARNNETIISMFNELINKQ